MKALLAFDGIDRYPSETAALRAIHAERTFNAVVSRLGSETSPSVDELTRFVIAKELAKHLDGAESSRKSLFDALAISIASIRIDFFQANPQLKSDKLMDLLYEKAKHYTSLRKSTDEFVARRQQIDVHLAKIAWYSEAPNLGMLSGFDDLAQRIFESFVKTSAVASEHCDLFIRLADELSQLVKDD